MKTLDLQKYESNLHEIKRRIDVIRAHVGGQRSTGFLITEVEFLALQFRKVIELIAFSSLILNRDEYAKLRASLDVDYRTDWSAKRIMNVLEKINPYFYPQPTKQTEKSNKDGKQIVELENITEGYLTKDEAINVYNDCSDILHIWNPYSENKDIDLKKMHAKFTEWGTKLVTLLNHHTTVFPHGGVMVAAEMSSRINGRPRALVFGQLSDDEARKLEANVKKELQNLGFFKFDETS
jgi:hypothetical protein